MTQKLYDLDSRLQNFEAKVISCAAGDGRYEIILDQTAFFPEGGGQPADTGTLNGVAVTDVRETQLGIIHYAAAEIPAGTAVTGQIDWDKRFRRMQNHTGEHIISGLVYKLYGFNNVGFHLGSGDVTVDFDGFLSREDLEKIELSANDAVIKNTPVKGEILMRGELEQIEYRSKIELADSLRIVTVEGVDRCACCAPHVSFTGEVGIIKLLDSMRYKGGVRIHMLCGFDALADYHEKYRSVAAISAALSAKQPEVAEAVERLRAELVQAKNETFAIRQHLLDMIIEGLKPAEGNLCLFEPALDTVSLRKLVNAGTELCGGICAAFSGNDEAGYQYVIGSKTVDLRTAAKEINDAIGGKGGGSYEMIQGSASGTKDEIEEYFRASKNPMNSIRINR